MSECFDANTRLTTRRGVIPAHEILVGDQLWHEEEWVGVEAIDRQPSRSGLMITTVDGYRIKLTPEHRMLVDGGRLTAEWIPAERLEIGDLTAMEPEAVGPTRLLRLPWPADSRKSRGGFDPQAFLDASDGPKVDITARWGRILGTFVGDGSCGQSTSITISCDARIRTGSISSLRTLLQWGSIRLQRPRRPMAVTCCVGGASELHPHTCFESWSAWA
jgi:hypothetical protein